MHTPGPWKAIHEPAHEIGDGVDNGGYRIDAEGVEQLAFVWALNHRYLSGGRPQTEGPAFGAVQAGYNARLITAAPELADAAMEAWKALSWAIGSDSKDKILANALSKLEAAIEKSGTFDFKAMRSKLEQDRTVLS